MDPGTPVTETFEEMKVSVLCTDTHHDDAARAQKNEPVLSITALPTYKGVPKPLCCYLPDMLLV